ncbi:NADH dehydrogenase [ubiquinone] 1 alpha subcomplex assembly factor 3 [Orycteropus afer afer]|uniref:NADH dehydrogenase [ubiquinone] 1 alpha subcomplex assembly factor 3 n=1 Tax=Orycteropus afer afer TaxID=1230840 RepID=A0AC54ZB02_ORYAF|nr:NADH dehydrogenase [ubiquinone] 1 alpha subcomplex assembly factor 3 [Orycteropus afer afer]
MAAVFVLRGLHCVRPVLRCPPAQLWWAPVRGHRLTPADDELYQRTRISLLQRDAPHAMYIDSYNSRGFTINGDRVLGPCALLPHSVVQWNVGSHQDITEESFSLFWMLEPPIEIIVVGTGDRAERLQPEVLRAMRQRSIAVEVQDTVRPKTWESCREPRSSLSQADTSLLLQPNACATFNFLCHEGRVTGAALIPPPGGAAVTSLVQAADQTNRN